MRQLEPHLQILREGLILTRHLSTHRETQPTTIWQAILKIIGLISMPVRAVHITLADGHESTAMAGNRKASPLDRTGKHATTDNLDGKARRRMKKSLMKQGKALSWNEAIEFT
jgi:hypothetical protein